MQEDAERFAQIENAGLLEKFTEFCFSKLEYSGEIDYDMELSEEDFMDILLNVEVPDDTSAEKIQLAFDSLEELPEYHQLKRVCSSICHAMVRSSGPRLEPNCPGPFNATGPAFAWPWMLPI